MVEGQSNSRGLRTAEAREADSPGGTSPEATGGRKHTVSPSSWLLRNLPGGSAGASLSLSLVEPRIQARKEEPHAARGGVSLFYLKTVLHYHLQRLRQCPSFA